MCVVNNFKVAVLRCNFVTRQCLTVIIRLGSSACGARAYWIKIRPRTGHVNNTNTGRWEKIRPEP